jgi:hypothetical protein
MFLLTPTRITLEISDGSNKATIVASYRWWTAEPDPWENLSMTVYWVDKGTWQHYSGVATFYGMILDIYTGVSKITEIFRIWGLPHGAVGNPFKPGQRGYGENKYAGGLIPVGPIEWRVVSIV